MQFAVENRVQSKFDKGFFVNIYKVLVVYENNGVEIIDIQLEKTNRLDCQMCIAKIYIGQLAIHYKPYVLLKKSHPLTNLFKDKINYQIT